MSQFISCEHGKIKYLGCDACMEISTLKAKLSLLGIQVTIRDKKLQRVSEALVAYNEYFDAIDKGQVQEDRQLRTFEKILLFAGRSAIADKESP